jgi:hypothetical protein
MLFDQNRYPTATPVPQRHPSTVEDFYGDEWRHLARPRDCGKRLRRGAAGGQVGHPVGPTAAAPCPPPSTA